LDAPKWLQSSNTEELGSDFFLIRLIDEIPIEYLPYFIGWNRDGSGSSQGFTIHHPQGDIKKISLFTDPLEGANYSDGINRGFWKVSWSQTANGHGVTEPGSSGSPIFDDEGYLIGTLSGGAASCSALTAPDYYGKFSVHWEDNGLAIDQQLAPWLDPKIQAYQNWKEYIWVLMNLKPIKKKVLLWFQIRPKTILESN
jgi:lysyl endopeptidase